METSRKKKSRKGRNKLILQTSYNLEGLPYNRGKKCVTTEDQASIKDHTAEHKPQLCTSVEPERTTAPQEAEPVTTPQKPERDISPVEPEPTTAHQEAKPVTAPEESEPVISSEELEPATTAPEPQPCTSTVVPEPARVPQEPERDISPKEAEPAPELIAEPELTVRAEQQPASPVQRPSVEAYCEQTNQALIQIPELELQRITGEKEEQISKLVTEKEALLKEVEQLKQLLETQTKEANLEHGSLLVELSKQGQTNREASHKIGQLEKALESEKEQRKEMEMSFAQQMEKNSKIKATLAQANEDLQRKRHQWEEDTSRLLAKQRDETSSLMAALNQAKEDLENERRQWKEEKSFLLESLNNDKKTLEEKEGASGGLMDRMSDLERKMDEIEAQEPKKPKKSLRKRFLRFFK